ncbi:WD repeat-containing protein 74-like [Linepithema humile]|uniref:WD repeat-containing protein 74 n=1 Tax=Linepithema humile TaxID=83485 RepID=UPI00351F2E37
MNKSNFDIFVGGTSGIFKGIQVGKKGQIVKNIQDLASITKNDQVTIIEWGNDKEEDILIACGLKENRRVKVYDSNHLVFTRSFPCDVGKGSIKGLSRCEGSILTAVESGEVSLWTSDKIEVPIINAGNNLEKMRYSHTGKNIITGGLENRLKVFDLEKQSLIFTEKDLPHDALQLRLPICITDLNLLPGTQTIATVSKYGYIRLYDSRAQRRPVINMQIQDKSWSCLSVTSKDKHIIVGSTIGTMNLVDLRKCGFLLKTYKGFTGAVTGITCSTSNPYIASVSLDRHLRIHHMDTKALLKQIYLTSNLTCIVMKSDFSF